MLASPNVPPNHGTVVVLLDDTRYVVDASILHGAPLRLDDHDATGIAHPAWGVECRRRDGAWFIHWRPMRRPGGMDCRLDQLAAPRGVFRTMHERTRRWSPFNYELHVRVLRGDTVVGVTKGHRVERDASGRETQAPLDGEDRITFLIDEVGVLEEIVRRLPPDRPIPPPP